MSEILTPEYIIRALHAGRLFVRLEISYNGVKVVHDNPNFYGYMGVKIEIFTGKKSPVKYSDWWTYANFVYFFTGPFCVSRRKERDEGYLTEEKLHGYKVEKNQINSWLARKISEWKSERPLWLELKPTAASRVSPIGKYEEGFSFMKEVIPFSNFEAAVYLNRMQSLLWQEINANMGSEINLHGLREQAHHKLGGLIREQYRLLEQVIGFPKILSIK